MNYLINIRQGIILILSLIIGVIVSLNLDYNYPLAVSAFLLSFTALSFYTLRSAQVILNGFRNEYNEQGNLPMLSIPYFMISVYYIGAFIYSFDTYFGEIKKDLVNALDFQSNVFLYTFALDTAFFCVIVAIACNISKALFTLNALEFGSIHKVDTTDFGELYLKQEYNSKAYVIAEVILRFFIAALFIFVELILSKNYEKKGYTFFANLGMVSTILFLVILCWFYLNKKRFKNNFITERWRKWSLRQYISGIVVSILIFFLGFSSQLKDFKELILLLFTVFIVASGLLIISIVINEIPEKSNASEVTPKVVINGDN